MLLPRLFLPAALVLSLLGLGAWAYATFLPPTDLEVENRSGKALIGLRVCLQVGGCAEQARLAPGQTWRVPLEVGRDNGAALTFDGMQDPGLANTYVTRGVGVRWKVGRGGQVQAAQ
ncbi:hypothetical protein [Deinococcus hopiensis]|uniref:Uncharacterized protein n=1 Tax=Deinococcus hopiensis KR-140 TaxID=695939 RepID=A0A1W1VE14_9DEIO|nr:hypothetical protein [Deinococcus hopiensis]SMB91453.1 hypothetical protein SAMN00790413_01134 [Deinococcus hopiensis KR-140]